MKSSKHKVQYYETDKMGIVHHSNYIRWFEECRVEAMEEGGLGYDVMEEEGIICPVKSVSCNYEQATKFGETVEIQARVEKFNGIRLKIDYQVVEVETGDLKCTGSSEHCFLDDKGHLLNLKKVSPRFYQLFQEIGN
ncbi:MAG: acyl-CoA thioesterase [Eubacterium sp.]|nr:acyl-CoA thioesterase [Eubacterium sp.]